MTTALSRFANVASTNGVPAIEAMSYALGAQETIQDASKVGNGLNFWSPLWRHKGNKVSKIGEG